MEKQRKKTYLMIGIISFGLITSIVTFFTGTSDQILKEGISLSRNEWGEGEKDVSLIAGIEGYEKNLEIRVEERNLSEKEIEVMYKELEELLPREILNGNSSLSEITDDLYLPSELQGFPFRLRWTSQNETVMDSKGKIVLGWNDRKVYEVTVTCVASFEDFRKETTIPLRIIPKQYSYEEEMSLLLEEAVKKEEENSREFSSFLLPSSLGGKNILWKEQTDFTPVYIFLGSLVVAFVVSRALEYDEKQKEKKEEELLLSLYPSFVDKFRMYLMAGLSSRNAFCEMYEELKDSGDSRDQKMRDILQRVINKFTNRVPEEKVYEEFGNECRGPYRKLSYILSVNLKQGNDKVLELLEEESLKVQVMKRETAKRKGDEAGVKILFPMVLMLMVVMVLIIIPAYINFN